MIDFSKKRAIVRANTSWIQGIPLEAIPAGASGYKEAMVIIHRDWKDVYFLIERDGWSEDQYFDFAKERMKVLGIEE